MRYPSRLIEAKLLERPNRFLGVVDIDGREELCFIPNPGRMHELMVANARVYLLEKRSEHRKTRYDMVLVDYGGVMVGVDSRLPNTLLAEAVWGLAGGGLVSFLVGLLSLGWLIRWLEQGRLHRFAWWVIPLGLAVVAWQCGPCR